ncbi:MAG: cytochrome b/b6 domain-containing protein [Desulfitobacterium hafniense]|nr:cytochrome b/b6 domain-containing protein [Desulfitobacterium hafniense]
MYKTPEIQKKKPKIRKALKSRFTEANLIQDIVLTQPLSVRVFHWGFALSMVIVIITGFELHKPASFLAVNFGQVFVLHIAAAFIASGLVAFRIFDALIRHDTSLIPSLKDLKMLPKLMAYYFFLRSTPPPSGKYNSGQKLIFSSWIIVFIISSVLGLASYWLGEHLIWVWRFIGGAQVIRWSKFVATIYFTCTIPVHIYLSLTEDLSKLQAMVTGYEKNSPETP